MLEDRSRRLRTMYQKCELPEARNQPPIELLHNTDSRRESCEPQGADSGCRRWQGWGGARRSPLDPLEPLSKLAAGPKLQRALIREGR